MQTRGPVIIMELPENLNHAEGRTFLSEMRPLLEIHRPRVVLDCSQVRQIDSAGIETLLHCMEEAMKRDGDLKLASLSPEAAAIMELMRVDRLFEVYGSADDAARSFHTVASIDDPKGQPWYSVPYGLPDLKSAS
jgi:anti-sigma B factor antagonist